MGDRFLDTNRIKITILSPVHIGTGEDYIPTNYIIDQQMLHHFDPALVLSLKDGEREELLECADSKDFMDIARFFYKRKSELALKAPHQVFVSDGIEKFYRNRIENPDKKNRLEINRAAYTHGSNAPFIPGSSLKGSIRTALLSHNNMDDKKAFECDPMRLVKVGDVTPDNDDIPATRIYFALNYKKKKEGAGKGPYQIMECLWPGRTRVFFGTIDFTDLAAGGVDIKRSRHPLPPTPHWKWKDIAEACNSFYRERLQDDMQCVESRFDTSWCEAMGSVINSRLVTSGDAFILRVGHHSGAESLTLKGKRRIKVRVGRSEHKKLDHSNTIWLAADRDKQEEGLLPFGWILVERADHLQELPEAIATYADRQHDLMEEQFNIFREKREQDQKRRQEKEQEQREAEERRIQEKQAREEEDRLREAKLDAMSDGERKLLDLRKLLEKPGPSQGKGGELWREVTRVADSASGWPEEERKKLKELLYDLIPKRINGMDKKKTRRELVILFDS